jgi:outer membrane protein assembly factor BamE
LFVQLNELQQGINRAMHTTLSSKRHLPALLLVVVLLAGCGVTTKKTFLDEPVQQSVGNAVPVSSPESGQATGEGLSRNPAMDSAEATGIQKLLNIITPYRINIQQGNFVSQEMLTRIQPGMTREQVRFALGTPLLTDPFHSARWDYLFRLQKPDGQVTNNRVIIYFEDNRVARIVNDPLPDETQYLESIAGPAPKKKVDDSDRKAAASTDKPEAARQADTPASDDTGSAAPVVTDSHEASPSGTETEETTPQPVETRRFEPAVTGTPETTPAGTETAETAPAKRETYRTTPTETRPYEKEATPTETTETVPAATEVKPVGAHTPTPESVRQEPPRKAATTTRAVSDGPEDDFRAAPNSTMQLHELMQPQ